MATRKGPTLVTDPRQGDRITISTLAQRYRINRRTLWERYSKGDRGEALIVPVRPTGQAKTNSGVRVLDPKRGDRVTISQLAQRYDLPANTLQYRYRNGKRGEELIRPPMDAKQKAAMRRAYLEAARDGVPKQDTAAARRELAAHIMHDPCNRWLTRPLAASA